MTDMSPLLVLGEVLLLHFAAPAVLTLLFDAFFRRIGWVREGDMKLSA